MAIKDLYPSVHPTLDLNFAGTRTVDPRITFTRASTATYFDEFGVMRTVPANSPRIDFDPVTGECKGLLLEEQRTNLLTYSKQFDNSSWNKTDATIQSNTTIAPDGVLSADKFIPNNVSTIHKVAAALSVISGTSYTISMYAKAGGYSGLGIVIAEAGFGTNTVDYFDLTTGKVTTNASGAAGISHVGNGWYRCTATRTATATIASTFEFRVGLTGLTGSNSFNFAGDGTSGIYIWGAQLEAGSFPTSYIKTEGSQVTRAADIASMSGANFSSWYNQSEGTLFAEAVGVNNISGNTRRFAEISNNGSSGYRHAIGYGTTTSTRFLTIVNGIPQADITAFAIAGTTVKIAAAYKANSFQQATNGVDGVEDTSGNVPVVNQLALGGYDPVLSTALNGHISRMAYYPKRLSNINLQSLTA